MAVLQTGHVVKLLQGGQAFFPALIAAIDASVHEVRIETYIFFPDVSGLAVASALARAAQRGVMVYLVVDGVGTGRLDSACADRFRLSGVHWRVFSPLGRLGLLIPSRWRRLHRKLCVIDGEVAFCGGINLLDDWMDPNHGALTEPRFDFAVQVSGPLVREAHHAMTMLWSRWQRVRRLRPLDFAQAWQVLQASVGAARASQGSPASGRHAEVDAGDTPLTSAAVSASAVAGLLLRDNLLNRTRIERAYRKAIGEADSEVIIASAYFLPGRKLRQTLVHAARRGVRVRLLLQGRYEYFFQYHAVRPVYGSLLAAGIEIYEYTASFHHAKVAVVDARWATVGSSNLDPLSLLLAREANVVVDDGSFAAELRQALLLAMSAGSVRVEPQVYAQRPWHQRTVDWLALALLRSALFLVGKRY